MACRIGIRSKHDDNSQNALDVKEAAVETKSVVNDEELIKGKGTW